MVVAILALDPFGARNLDALLPARAGRLGEHRGSAEMLGCALEPDAHLEAFFNANLSNFTPAEQFRISLLAPAIPVPDAPLTLRSIADYLGVVVANHIKTANPGETIEVLSDGQRFEVTLTERTGGDAPLFQNVRPMVEREYRRTQGEKAFNEYLVWLRDRADIEIPAQGP